MQYEEEIFRILALSGSNGLHLSKLSRHVYNALNSFFHPIDYEEIHKMVSSFVVKKAKDNNSIIERTSRGMYRLNPQAKETEQLMLKLQFDETN